VAATGSARTARRLALAALAMFGFGFALAPLYDVACEALGLNGRSQALNRQASAVQTEPAVDRSRTVTVEFVASTAQGMPWAFGPSVARMQVHPGELAHTTYRARNLSQRPVVGQAVPSVAPGSAAKYFHKLECFCFTRQELAAGEEKDMPVRFRLDPKLDPAVHTVTLSYTFFDAGSAG
jgi:cytochrome c oxidase assembly protein subunit 11